MQADAVSAMRAEWLDEVTGTLTDRLAAILARGGSAAELAAAVKAALSDDASARLIALTEWNRALNLARFRAYQAARVNRVRWVTTSADPCARCLENEAAGPRDLGSPFPSGAVMPPEHPQCQCELIRAEDLLGILTLPDGSKYETGGSAVKSHWDGETVKGVVVKALDEQRFTLQVAYPADSPDTAIARDGYQDFASPDAVEKAAHSFMENGRQVGLFHQDGTDGAGTVVESYVYRGPDWRIDAPDGSTQVIKSGDWMIGIRWDEPAWNLIKSGDITGVSMQGGAKRKLPSPAEVARVVAARNGRV